MNKMTILYKDAVNQLDIFSNYSCLTEKQIQYINAFLTNLS